MTALNLDHGLLREALVEDISLFARAFPPVKDRVTHIKEAPPPRSCFGTHLSREDAS